MTKGKTRGSAHDVGRAALAWATTLALAAALVPAAALAQETETTTPETQLTAQSGEEDGSATELEQAEQALEEAEEALESIEESGEYASALEAAEEGSYGFFVWLGDAGEGAVEVMDDPTGHPYYNTAYSCELPVVAYATEGSATTLANLIDAVPHLYECNEYRVAEGADPQSGEEIGELDVSPTLMAMEELMVDWSSVYWENDEVMNYLHHSCAFRHGRECLVLGPYVAPFYYWVDQERESMGGHYTTVMDADVDAMGYALGTLYDVETDTHVSGLNVGYTGYFTDAMPLEEFDALLSDYLDEIHYDTIEAHEEAQEALEEAQAAYEKAATVAKVEVLESGLTFTGEEIEPEVAVYSKAGGLMEEGVGYELSYEDNVDASSSAAVTATGVGECTGEATAKFKISRLDASDATVVLSSYEVVWNGDDTCPDVYLELADGTLVGQYSSTGKNNFSVLVTKSTVTDLDGVTTGTGKVKVSGNSGAYNCLLESDLTATFSIVAPEDDEEDDDGETSDGTTDGDSGATSAGDSSGEEDSTNDSAGEDVSSDGDADTEDAGTGDTASSGGGDAAGDGEETDEEDEGAGDAVDGTSDSSTEEGSADDSTGEDASSDGDADAEDVGAGDTASSGGALSEEAGEGAGDAADDGEDTPTVKAAKAEQALKVTKAATKTVKASKLKKRARTVKVIKKVTGAKGALAYKKLSVKRNGKKASKKVARKVAVNAKTGKVTLKKGLAKGTYKVQVRVKAAATSKYKAASKVVTVKVKVK